jgi:dimethylhistidine N-methyltransferase
MNDVVDEGARTLFRREVVAGLASRPKTLPCKYFYDARGSELFERICELDEYYLTRADFEATSDNIARIVAHLGPELRLVELGSGSSLKTRLILDHLVDPCCYVPIDISESALAASAAALARAYPHLEVLPVHGDYTQPLRLPAPRREPARTAVYFPGSTIGNLHPVDAIPFLRRIRAACRGSRLEGGALIGVDVKKDRAVLERAYDDAQGVTAAFNLNLLARINRELGADFDLDAFAHRAVYDERLGRIEMHLTSRTRQTVTLPAAPPGARHDGEAAAAVFDFDAGESVRTEESYKYSLDDFGHLAAEAGLRVEAVFQDRRALFSLQYLVPIQSMG